MVTFQKKKLALCVALIGACGYSQVASAQGSEEELVVTGFRSSLKTALDTKRNTVGSVDSIVAEDIGDFPDNNLADAMARIPGVNITRVGGEGQQISVRGLPSTFTRVRVNGMETIAAGYGNTSRAFDFNMFASELFSRVDVKKTQSATLEEGSLGATVEMYTGRPLDAKGNSIVVGLSQGYNDRSGDMDPRLTGLVSLQNEDGTFGGSFSVAYSQRSLTQEGNNSGRWEANSNSGNNMWANADSLPDEVNGAFHPRFPRQLDRGINLDRLGITGALQWQPVDATKLTFDLLHSDFTYQQNDRTLTPISLARTGSGGRLETTVVDYEYDASKNALVYAQLSGVDVRAEQAFVDSDSTFDQYSLSLEQDFGESLHLKALLGSSKSETDVGEESTAIFENFNQDFTYDYRNDPYDPDLDYDFDLTNPSNWTISEIRNRPRNTENTYDVAQLDLAWDLNDNITLNVGASSKEFSFDTYGARQDRGLLEQGSPQGAVSVPDGCGITAADLTVSSGLGDLYTPGNGQNEFLMPDFTRVGDQVGFSEASPCFPLVPRDGDIRGVTETSSGYYAQLDFRAELGSMSLAGDVGMRDVTTDVESTGIVSGTEVTVERSYSDQLPALNLALSLTEDLMLRASWAEVMTRPALGNLTPGGSIDGFNRSYSAGNPGLNPFRATATDLSLDWYFNEEALLSFAWFEKDIESFPSTETETVPWTSLGLPNSLLDQFPATPDENFDYRRVSDGLGGSLDGWEIQFQTPFTFGPAWLQNFGVKANYSSISSKVNSGTEEEPVYSRLNGQSDTAYNGTLWYENDAGFSGRVSYTYRSDYNTRPASRLGEEYGSDIIDAEAYVDAKVGYKFNDNLTVSLDLLNLSDESETSLLGSNLGLVDTTLKAGRQYYLSVQYKF